jgi:hypothetical protein
MAATGTFYLHVGKLREMLGGRGGRKLAAKIVEWDAHHLLGLIRSAAEDQAAVYEEAYCGLTHLLTPALLTGIGAERLRCQDVTAG